MAPNAHFCGDGGRQSMMSVPSLVLIPADNPNDAKVLCKGRRCVSILPGLARKPPTPSIKVIPPSPRLNSNRKKWDKKEQTAIKTVDENEAHDWSMEDLEQVQTKVSSKCHSNTYVDNKNVTPFIIRRSPLKQVPSSKAEEVGPSQEWQPWCKLNFNQISMSDESEGSIRTPNTPEVKQVFFTSPDNVNKTEDSNNDINMCDEVFDEVSLTSPQESISNTKAYCGSNGSEVDSNNNSVNKDDTLYNVTGEDWPPIDLTPEQEAETFKIFCDKKCEDWPPIDLTPEQEAETFKIFCDKKFRESGGVTPVIVGMIPKSLPGGPTIRMPGVSAHYSYTGGIMPFNKNTIGTNRCSPAAVHPADFKITAQESKNDFERFANNTLADNKNEQGNAEANQHCSKSKENKSSGGTIINESLHNIQRRNSSSFVTPPAQTWHNLVLKQNAAPTPSPSQLCMQMNSSKTVPLWTTPAVIKGPHAQVLACNSELDNIPDSYLDFHNKDIGDYCAPSLWSTPAILNADSSKQVILRTPAIQGGVYSSFTQGSHYSSLTKRRSYSTLQSESLEPEVKEMNEASSTAPISYMGIITNIFKGIFGGLDKVDIPVIYPHYDVANGVPTVETEKKND